MYDQFSDDPLNVANFVKNTVIKMHECAISAGCFPVSEEDWTATCSALWRGTSAGMQSETIIINLADGQRVYVKSKNKLVVGSVLGEKLFMREMLEKHFGKENHCVIGYRDVPYRPTR